MRSTLYFLYFIRILLAALIATNVAYIVSPDFLAHIGKALPLRDASVELATSNPGFDQHWLSVATLLITTAYIYIAILSLMVLSIFFDLVAAPSANRPRSAIAWYSLKEVFIYWDAPDSTENNLTESTPKGVEKRRIGRAALDLLIVVCTVWILNSALSHPSTEYGILERFYNAFAVGLLGYSSFSIAAWLLQLGFLRLKNGSR